VSSSKNAEEVLTIAGIRDFFPVVVDGVVSRARAALQARPRHVRGGAHARRRPARSAAVEDAHSGVASAAAAGFGLVVGVDRGAGAQALLDLGATLVVDDLSAFVTR
jgi:beta-phosphoglucomutase-like phosphatase (HAD superfamily)